MKKRMISIVLVLALLVQILPTYVFAENNASDAPPIEAVEMETREPGVVVLSEMTDQRGEREKHVRLNDSSFVAVDSGVPVRFTAAPGTGRTEDGAKPLKKAVSEEEIEMIANKLKDNGFGGESVDVQVLFDSQMQDKFIIGISENGYIIVERETFRFCECGETNPYYGYEDHIYYYGGPLCYYINADGIGDEAANYYNILTGELCDRFNMTQRQSIEKKSTISSGEQNNSQDPVYLPKSFEYIRRKAFGYNNDNTCSAVATGIALNYIANHENMNIVSNIHIHEDLDNSIYSAPGQTYEVFISTTYPKAYNLHRFIVDQCGMGAASYGLFTKLAINDYINYQIKSLLSFPDNYKYNMSVSNTPLPASDTIRLNISEGKPVIISTLQAGDSDYQYHTMCVYGHRTVNNEDQLLIHTGWYCGHSGSTLLQLGNSDKYYHKIIWIDETWATHAHYFSYDNPLSEYADIPSFTDYRYNGILFCVHNGYMLGTDESHFSPDIPLDRAMYVQILYRMEGSPSVQGYTVPFTDVSTTSYYYNALCWAYHNGIVAGTTPTTFSPHENLQRQQLAVALYAYATYKGEDTSNLENISNIPDWSNVSTYAKTAVRWAIAEGLLVPYSGMSGYFYLPQSDATRAQTAYAGYIFAQ